MVGTRTSGGVSRKGRGAERAWRASGGVAAPGHQGLSVPLGTGTPGPGSRQPLLSPTMPGERGPKSPGRELSPQAGPSLPLPSWAPGPVPPSSLGVTEEGSCPSRLGEGWASRSGSHPRALRRLSPDVHQLRGQGHSAVALSRVSVPLPARPESRVERFGCRGRRAPPRGRGGACPACPGPPTSGWL